MLLGSVRAVSCNLKTRGATAAKRPLPWMAGGALLTNGACGARQERAASTVRASRTSCSRRATRSRRTLMCSSASRWATCHSTLRVRCAFAREIMQHWFVSSLCSRHLFCTLFRAPPTLTDDHIHRFQPGIRTRKRWMPSLGPSVRLMCTSVHERPLLHINRFERPVRCGSLRPYLIEYVY